MGKFILTGQSLRGSQRKKTLRGLFEKPEIKKSINTRRERKDISEGLSKKNYTKSEFKKFLIELGGEDNSISPKEAMRVAQAFKVKGVSRAKMRRFQKRNGESTTQSRVERIKRKRATNRTYKKGSEERSSRLNYLRESLGTLGEKKGRKIMSSDKDISSLRGGGRGRSSLTMH